MLAAAVVAVPNTATQLRGFLLAACADKAHVEKWIEATAVKAGYKVPEIRAEWQRLNGTIYSDSRSAYQVGMWVNRVEQETTVTAAFPSNPIARESVLRYLQAMKSVYLSVVEGRSVAVAAIAADTVDLDLKTA